MGYALMCDFSPDMDGRTRFHRFRYHLAAGFVTPTDIVADYGCGTGYGSDILSRRFLQVLSYDKEEANINCAKDKYQRSNIIYRQADLEIMKIPYVDVAVAFESLEHLYKPKEFIDKLKAKTRKYIIASVPLNQSLVVVNGDVQEVGDSTHHYAFTRQSFMDMFIDENWKEFWSFQDGVTLISVLYNRYEKFP
jgi:protein-L-isoaspartate O-methyltransferase